MDNEITQVIKSSIMVEKINKIIRIFKSVLSIKFGVSINSKRQLYFLHIKKTAGTTLRKFLERQFSFDQVLPPMNVNTLVNLPKETVQKLRFVAGHFDTTYLQYYKTSPFVITVLRHPIDRVVSEYYYWKDPLNNDDDPRKPSDIQRITLEEYIQREESSNIQAKSLSVGLYTPEQVNIKPDVVVSKAVATLNDSMVFGFSDSMDQFIDMLTYTFGWRPTSLDQKINTNENRTKLSELPQKAVDLIESHNDIDFLVYQQAKNIFSDRYIAFLILIFGVTKAFVLKNRPYAEVRPLIVPYLWKRYYRRTSELPRVNTITYTFDMPLSGEYWMRSEGNQSMTSFMWRWTSGENATIDFPLQRSKPLRITFRVKSIIGNNFSVFTDGDIEIPVKEIGQVSNIGNEKVFTGIIPPNNSWRSTLSTITFHCENLQSPQRNVATQITDDRKLGVAIDWIKIIPD